MDEEKNNGEEYEYFEGKEYATSMNRTGLIHIQIDPRHL